MVPRCSCSAPLVVLVAAMMLFATALPKVQAGAVFEIREKVVLDRDSDLKFVFNQEQVFKNIGSIVRSAGKGAGAVFATSAIPLSIFNLNKCTAVAPHIHPNAAETLFVLEGKIRIHSFRGEEDGNTVRVIEVSENEAGYIQQGAYHVVENISGRETKFLQIFDHPQAGAVFAAPALVALPRNLVNSAFSEKVLDRDTGANGALIRVRGCK